MKIYDDIVSLYPDKITTNVELDNIMKSYNLQRYKFIGVYSRDTIPKRMRQNTALIFNNEDSNESGEHWLCYAKDSKNTYIYDSFGRPNKYFDFGKKYIQTHPDAEQDISQNNCGFRCISFLVCCEIFTVEIVSKYI